MTKIPKHKQIREFQSFSDLVRTPFEGNVNAHFWNRQLQGDFQEIVEKLQLEENITEIHLGDLHDLELSDWGLKAKEIISTDFQLLSDYGAQPSLNLIKCYPRDDEFDLISTDVYSYHVDRSPIATDTFLCTYYGASSDILPNDQAIQKIKIPEIRAELKKLCPGSDKEFDLFLRDYFFDLHYEATENAQPINLENGFLWRIAVDHPNQKVLPCIHRAPMENEHEYRLLLIC